MSLWSMLAAPLLAGNDLRNVPTNILAILTNREVIAIDQDKLTSQGRRQWQSGEQEIWTRQLAAGDHAVAIFNRGAAPATVTANWMALQIVQPTVVRDLWTHQDEQVQGDEHAVTVPAHGVVMWRVK
jgi:alpha-galactosidase